MWRALTLALTLIFQSTAWPERHATKVHGETGEVHGCWADNDFEVVECEFPFEYQGKDHNKCLPYGSGFWCATTRRYTDNPSKWGYCNQCDRVKYWKTDDARSGHFSDNEDSATYLCEIHEINDCGTCTPEGQEGGNCQDSFKYNAIIYGGCDRSLLQNGKPFCLYSEDPNDWGYCNPDVCPSKKAVGAMEDRRKSSIGENDASASEDGGDAARVDSGNGSGKGNSNNSEDSEAESNNSNNNSQTGDGGWTLSEKGKDRKVPADEYYSKGKVDGGDNYYYKMGRPANECVGGSLLFEPRPCDRDCRTVMGIHVNCDPNKRGCACEEGKFWAENQGRCVEEAECKEQDVFRVKRPCGFTYRGMFRCQYPFTYEGKEYNTCAKWKGRDWCSLDPGAYEVHRRWGYCEGLMGRDEDKCPPAPEV